MSSNAKSQRICRTDLRYGFQGEPKSKISREKVKKFFLLKSTQNSLKRIENQFSRKKNSEKKFQAEGWDLEKKSIFFSKNFF